METTTIALHAIKFIALGAVFIGVTVYVVLKLWNWLIPQLFKGPAIRFKQALGLMALSFLLFGGFRFHKPYLGNHSNGSEIGHHCKGELHNYNH